jgi:hypothetical protein
MPSSSFTLSFSLESALLLWVSAQRCRALLVSHSNALTRVGKYKWTKARFVIGVLSQIIGQIAFTAWALYLWIDVRGYGSQHECNDEVKYVVMFFTIRATKHWLRGLWIAIIILSALGLFVGVGTKAYYTLIQEEAQAEQRVQEEQEDVEEEAEAEDENKESDRAWYFRWRHLNFLYVISLSPASNAH